MIITGIIIVAAIGLCVFDLMVNLGVVTFQSVNDKMLAFQSGLLLGIATVALMTSVKYIKALKDAKALQLLYNEEHDERQKEIRMKAGMPMIGYTSVLMIFTGIVAGYVNITIFYTLIAAAMAQLIVCLMVKLYHQRIM